MCTRKLVGRGECRTVLSIGTDGNGAVVVSCHRCAWQLAGRCWRCGLVRDTGARALYCASCADARRLEAGQKSERSPKAKAAARKRDRVRNRGEHRRQWRAAWLAANPDRVRAYKRRQALNPTERRRERERYHNSRPERIAAKRAQALAKYYELHPVRPTPVCRDCSQPIAWTPPGRPPVRCDACVPHCVRAKRKRPAVTVGGVA